MMRNDEIDLSQHRSSRIPRVVMIVATLGVALVAAWVFAPILLANYSAGTATASVSPKPRVAAQTAAPRLASAQSAPALATADTTAVATADDQNSPAAPAGPAVGDTTASTTLTAPPWPQDRGIQAAPAANADTMQVAAVAPADTPAEPFENVPLPRKRPSRLIAASLNIPLPRPRPDIPTDAPPVDQSTFDLQVERMR
jgi:hypothetical protein